MGLLSAGDDHTAKVQTPSREQIGHGSLDAGLVYYELWVKQDAVQHLVRRVGYEVLAPHQGGHAGCDLGGGRPQGIALKVSQGQLRRWLRLWVARLSLPTVSTIASAVWSFD